MMFRMSILLQVLSMLLLAAWNLSLNLERIIPYINYLMRVNMYI